MLQLGERRPPAVWPGASTAHCRWNRVTRLAPIGRFQQLCSTRTRKLSRSHLEIFSSLTVNVVDERFGGRVKDVEVGLLP